ncbi:efflux RND transporter permease subunit [Chitinophaga pendula]|uniref:efflux RND transporter permease subunit n=1 Tax=Chitinophaga TaxID=79328 RepID=UPI000BAE8A77|nr:MULTISPECIES: efflux RND transporter permease subunit [Chitinophaga]ASZ13019.1 acriflavin resistance protein [Chitinophaga sp. MD30]UCJ09350.1 efflux RND transporter permease subunit [Chitinophaga pendula]
MNIAEIAIKRPLLIIVIFTVLILFGIQSYFSLNYNLLPRIKVNAVTVTTIYPGASAAEVQLSVTKKLEDAFASIEGLDQISSTSQEGVSSIVVQLKASADVDKAERDIQRKADQSENELPDNIERPNVSKVNLDETPVIRAAVTAGLSSRQLYDLIDLQLQPILQNVAGVGQVNIIGGEERQIKVNIDQRKMLGYHLSIAQVTQAIANANQSFPAGSIENNKQQLTIQYNANFNSIEQLRNTIVFHNDEGGNIYLRDIADVADGTAKTTAINHINGLPAIGIEVIKQTDANAVNVSRLVKKSFEKIEQQYASSKIQFTICSDQSTYTLASANAVMEDLGLAILIVGIVMLAFLHSLRSAMFVMVALPCSIIPTFIGMYLMDFSLNLMTLMAMSLVVGILVDDSIVVLENIYRHMEMGSDRVKAAIEGRSEIGFTALAITLVDVVVFLPLALSGGIIGAILKEFSLVVVISTLMSLFVSFTVTPMLASRFGKVATLHKRTWWGRINTGFEHFIDTLRKDYGRLLAKVLHKKRWLLSGVLVLLLGSFLLIGFGCIGAAFIPGGDQGELVVKLEMDPATTIYRTSLIAQQAEKFIMAQPEVVKVSSNIGFVGGGVARAGNNNNQSEITVTLVDKKHRTRSSEEWGLQIQQQLSSRLPGVKVSTGIASISGQAAAPIQIAVKGNDINAIRKIAQAYKDSIANVPGARFVELSVKDQKQQVEVLLNRDKMTRLGLNASQVGAALQQAFNGNKDSKYKENGNEYDILISLDNHDRSRPSDVSNLTFTNNQGQAFVLSQFADIRQGLGESVLQRNDRMDAITVSAEVIGRPVGVVAAEIQQKVKSITLPPGLSVEYLGDVKNQSDAFGSLGLAFLTAILLVYLIMVALYENAVYPFVVLFSIPVALIGALLALALSMETLNIFSIIGMIMLLGLVAKNAILIVDFTNQQKTAGKSVRDALIEAGEERLRPILMTTLAMILGMLPIAIAAGAGSEVKSGMAWVIIGGLISSMLLTLFVVPAMYLIVDNILAKVRKHPPQAIHPALTP